MSLRFTSLTAALILLLPSLAVTLSPSRADTSTDDHSLLVKLAAEVDSDHATIAAQQNTIVRLSAQLAALKSNGPATVSGNASYGPFTVTGTDVYLTGYNLHIQSGSGSTTAAPNGLGNLIIGYNEKRGGNKDVRTGSHDLIMGYQNNYTSYSSIVAGLDNDADGPEASILGGYKNKTTGRSSVILSGDSNVAEAHYTAIVGGEQNFVTEDYAVVAGGAGNLASGVDSAVGGGAGNNASGEYSFAAGGSNNSVSGTYAASLGGQGNAAPSYDTTVTGGYDNTAFAESSIVVGGNYNTTGDLTEQEEAIGSDSAIIGGYSNNTTGDYACVVSGGLNTASGFASGVGAGYDQMESSEFGWLP